MTKLTEKNALSSPLAADDLMHAVRMEGASPVSEKAKVSDLARAVFEHTQEWTPQATSTTFTADNPHNQTFAVAGTDLYSFDIVDSAQVVGVSLFNESVVLGDRVVKYTTTSTGFGIGGLIIVPDTVTTADVVSAFSNNQTPSEVVLISGFGANVQLQVYSAGVLLFNTGATLSTDYGVNPLFVRLVGAANATAIEIYEGANLVVDQNTAGAALVDLSAWGDVNYGALTQTDGQPTSAAGMLMDASAAGFVVPATVPIAMSGVSYPADKQRQVFELAIDWSPLDLEAGDLVRFAAQGDGFIAWKKQKVAEPPAIPDSDQVENKSQQVAGSNVTAAVETVDTRVADLETSTDAALLALNVEVDEKVEQSDVDATIADRTSYAANTYFAVEYNDSVADTLQAVINDNVTRATIVYDTSLTIDNAFVSGITGLAASNLNEINFAPRQKHPQVSQAETVFINTNINALTDEVNLRFTGADVVSGVAAAISNSAIIYLDNASLQGDFNNSEFLFAPGDSGATLNVYMSNSELGKRTVNLGATDQLMIQECEGDCTVGDRAIYGAGGVTRPNLISGSLLFGAQPDYTGSNSDKFYSADRRREYQYGFYPSAGLTLNTQNQGAPSLGVPSSGSSQTVTIEQGFRGLVTLFDRDTNFSVNPLQLVAGAGVTITGPTTINTDGAVVMLVGGVGSTVTVKEL